MKKISQELKAKIVQLRRFGLSHRQIAQSLTLSVGTAFYYSKGVRLTRDQHLFLMRQNLRSSLSKLTVKEKLEAARRGGFNTSSHFEKQYTENDLLKAIQAFYMENGRIPSKKEFHYEKVIRNRFGSWNRAIKAAGFIPNPVKFASKHIANDGHMCDSFTEKIIDDWLSTRGISHERSVRYLKGRFTADFKIKDTFIEFFGLSGQLKKYDTLMKQKIDLIQQEKVNMIAIYPKDLFPKTKLDVILNKLIPIKRNAKKTIMG